MTKQYAFTSEGVQLFLDNIIGDVMDSLHETGCYDGDIYITVGARKIVVPMVAETYEAIERALHDAVGIWETEYTREEKENA